MNVVWRSKLPVEIGVTTLRKGPSDPQVYGPSSFIRFGFPYCCVHLRTVIGRGLQITSRPGTTQGVFPFGCKICAHGRRPNRRRSRAEKVCGRRTKRAATRSRRRGRFAAAPATTRRTGVERRKVSRPRPASPRFRSRRGADGPTSARAEWRRAAPAATPRSACHTRRSSRSCLRTATCAFPPDSR